jgi:DNA mismatch repair protein MutL
MTLRQLPPVLVNRIAAGEVVERPAAATKELVENAIDAGARRIEVVLHDGGQSLIAVSDDGAGMSAGELTLAVERHCTSKLPDDDLLDIRWLGFRGEALPSIGAVSRLTLTSRGRDAADAWSVTVDAGAKSAVRPAAHPLGTKVEVRDLFYATPARLKFLKTPRAERDQAVDVVERLAMAHPEITFTVLVDEGRALLRLPAVGADLASPDGQSARRERLAAVLGRSFADNALPVEAVRESVRLTGFIGLPTLGRATSRDQYLFVNGRPVRDKLLLGAVRGAYQDFLARDRHPMVVLFLDLPASEVDVNVHQARTHRRRSPRLHHRGGDDDGIVPARRLAQTLRRFLFPAGGHAGAGALRDRRRIPGAPRSRRHRGLRPAGGARDRHRGARAIGDVAALSPRRRSRAIA